MLVVLRNSIAGAVGVVMEVSSAHSSTGMIGLEHALGDALAFHKLTHNRIAQHLLKKNKKTFSIMSVTTIEAEEAVASLLFGTKLKIIILL